MEEKIDIEQLYFQYHQDIYQFLLYFTNSVQDAEDITQETFIKAIRNKKTIQDPTRVKFWLLSIARNTAIDHIRKKKWNRLLPHFFEKLTTDEKPLDNQLIFKERWEDIQQALLKIKPHYRSLIILRGIHDFTTKETADILGCTELKVRVDFHRAVKVLQKHLNYKEEEVIVHEPKRHSNSRN